MTVDVTFIPPASVLPGEMMANKVQYNREEYSCCEFSFGFVYVLVGFVGFFLASPSPLFPRILFLGLE